MVLGISYGKPRNQALYASWKQFFLKVSKQLLVVISMIFCINFYENSFFRSRFETLVKAVSSYKSTRFYFFKKWCSCDLRRKLFFLPTSILRKSTIKTGFEDRRFFSACRFRFSIWCCLLGDVDIMILFILRLSHINHSR